MNIIFIYHHIIDMVDLRKLVKFNKLSKEFIDEYVIPRIYSENYYDDYDGIDEYDIEKYQNNL